MNNDNQVAIYSFDPSTKVLTGVRYEAQSYELKAGETLVAPQDGMRPPYTWNGTGWDQASVDEFNAQHPSNGPEVVPSTQALNLLGQQLSEATQNNNSFNEKLDELTSSVNMLGQMIAKVTPASAPASTAESTASTESTAPVESTESSETDSATGGN